MLLSAKGLKYFQILCYRRTESHDALHTIVNGDGVHGRANTVGGHYSDVVLGIVGDIGDDYASG